MNFEAFKDLTRIEHALFGLPFVLATVFLALLEPRVDWWEALWILPAFLTARISGMAFNQLIDRDIDAQNPRTKHRAIPTGRVSVKLARAIAWGSWALFLLICFRINWICFVLAPVAAFLIAIYAYMKRVHASCHFVLGMIHFLAPVMAFAALTGNVSWPAIFLGLGAFGSIAGNDIAYAMQDFEFDRQHKLHSLPALLGIQKSLLISKYCHAVCVLSLFCVGIFAKLPVLYFVAPAFALGVLLHFHSTLNLQYKKTRSLTGIESSFFFATVGVSFSTFFFLALSVLWAVLF